MSCRPSSTLFAGIAIALLLLGCTAPLGATTSSDPPAASTATTPTSGVPGTAGDCQVVSVAAELAPYTIASLAAEGKGFVVGDVKAIQPAIYNTLDGKRPRNFQPQQASAAEPGTMGQILTPVVLQADQILSGDAATGSLRVVVQGGTIGCDSMRVDVAPVVEVGQRYVFVLSDAFDADGLKLPNLSLVRFAWPMGADGVVATPEGALPLANLAQTVAKAAPAPTN